MVHGHAGEPDVVLEADRLAGQRSIGRTAHPALANEDVVGILFARGPVARIAVLVREHRLGDRQIVETIDFPQHAVHEHRQVAGLLFGEVHVRLGSQGLDLVQRRAADEAAQSGFVPLSRLRVRPDRGSSSCAKFGNHADRQARRRQIGWRVSIRLWPRRSPGRHRTPEVPQRLPPSPTWHFSEPCKCPAPVVQEDSSDTRKTTHWATSSGIPIRHSGIFEIVPLHLGRIAQSIFVHRSPNGAGMNGVHEERTWRTHRRPGSVPPRPCPCLLASRRWRCRLPREPASDPPPRQCLAPHH